MKQQTKKLKNMENEAWALAFDVIDDIVTIQDENLQIVRANLAAHRFFQAEDGELTGKSCYRIFTGKSEPCPNCPLLLTLKNGHKHSADIVFPNLGKTFHVSSSIIPPDQSGTPYLIHIARDITEHSKAETALKESEERFAKAFESNPAPMVVSDISSGLFIDVNQRWIQMLGYSREELIGHTSGSLGIWQNLEARNHMISEFSSKGFIKEYPITIVTKSGEPRCTRWSAEKITLGGEEVMLSLIYDATDSLKTENALRESEEKFALAFMASPDAVNLNRLEDGLYLEINSGFTKLTGYTREDVLGKSSLDIDIWHDPADRMQLVESLQKKGYCENLEAKFRRKDGSLTTALLSARTISLQNVPHIISITRDISELRRAEKDSLFQKKLFETMFNAIPAGVVITDINRKIQLANKGMETTFGYLPEELQGQTTEKLYADPRAYGETGGKIVNREAKQQDQLYVTSYRHKSGWEFPGETFGTKLYNQDNEWIGNLGIMRDITERQKNEAERDRLIAAIEQTSEIVVITNHLGEIQYANPAFESITGYTQQEVLGHNPRILKSGEHDAKFYQNLWRTISTGRTFKGRMINKRKDGSLYTEETTISPICGADGQVVNYIAVKRDITEQILLEKQLQTAQKMESVGRLTGGVAHDFNNILGVIIGYSQMALKKVDVSETLHGDLQKILDAAERSAAIVRQLLAFSRQQAIAPAVLDINSTVGEMQTMLHRLIGEDIDLVWLPQPNLPPIKIDPAQMDQLLANLCVNARDAIEGTGKIIIETGKTTLDEDYCADHVGFLPGEFIQLTISDDGSGINNENLQNIFEPFFSTKELHRGTGLGLSTVYGIVKQNKGYINVYSEIGHGTTFKIYLPPCNEVAQPSNEKTVEKFSNGKNETVLLVEDDLALLTMTSKMLKINNYEVLMASSPDEALELVGKHKNEIQLLLTDVVMPKMNGKELAGQIQSHCPDIKCLFMSGYTSNVIANRGILDEGINFIQKPFTRNDLAEKIRDILDDDWN